MKVLLEAPILTQSGYGEHSRLVFRALLSQRADVYVNPLGWGQTGWISKFDSEREIIERSINNFHYAHQKVKSGEDFSFDMQIHVGIPNEFTKRAPYSICVTAGIETDRVSSNWIIKTHKEIDKLIVPSNHSKDSFINTAYEAIDNQQNLKTILKCDCPVEVVPYPVKNIIPDHLDMSFDTDFNFLSIALLGARKNLDNMINWFVEEFKDENVGLILKTATSTGSNIDYEHTRQLLERILSKKQGNRKCKVFLLHGDLSEEQIHSLYVRDDINAYITTTHGEGYGLPIFESAYSGLPVVATNWSGHLDFLEAKVKEKKKIKLKKLFAEVDFELKEIPNKVVWKDILIEGSQWAYPKETSFKKQIRNVYKNYSLYKKRALILQKEIKQNFSQKQVISKMKEAIFSDFKKNSEEEIMVL